MMSTSKTIVFFGTDTFSTPTLTALINASYSIGAVVTKPDSRSGRGQHLTPPLVKSIAEEHDIPVWQPADLATISDDIRALGDVVGVLVSYGKIVPQSIIDLFSPGIINVHPSRLPKYRGPSPLESAIINGDDSTSISVMLLTAGMDAGPVYGYTDLDLDGTETQASLYETAAELGAETLINLLPLILSGEATSVPQDDDQATYSHLLTKSDSLLDPTALTAAEAERKIRAHNVFPKTKITVHEQTVTVTNAHVAAAPTSLSLECKDGAYLIIDELIGPSGRHMSGQDFLNGYAA
jgi:methionyl-tRNA formyltransferase